MERSVTWSILFFIQCLAISACADEDHDCGASDVTTGADTGPYQPFEMDSIEFWGGAGGFESEGPGLDQFYYPSGIALSQDESEVFVYDAGNTRIKVLGRDGSTLRHWDHEDGCGEFGVGTNLAVGGGDTIYLVESGTHKVVGYDAVGDVAQSWELQAGPGDCNHNHPLVIDDDGNVIIAELPRGQLQTYTSTGELVRVIGSRGSGKGQFEYGPYALALKDGLLYAADNFDHNSEERFLIFDLSGQFKGYLQGTQEAPMFGISTAFTSVHGWLVGISDATFLGVVLLPPGASNFEYRWETEPGRYPGQLRAPFAMAISSEGLWYVTEYYNGRIQVFRPSITIE